MLALAALCLLGAARAQRVDTSKGEQHPRVAIQHCTAAGCAAQQASVTLDSQWRQVLDPSTGTNCFEAGSWNPALCSDPSACASTCALAGLDLADYATKYGVSQVNGGVQLKYVNEHNSIGSRLYLMETDDRYKMLRLKNREVAFDVDVSKLPCGLNGAVYFSEMEADGGLGGLNKAGAKYGTGYCDAQCPHDVKFMEGKGNVQDWNVTDTTGRFGACCAEMDIWEANAEATAYTVHGCTKPKTYVCEGLACGDNLKEERYKGVCDKDGCDFNSFRMGDEKFFGHGPGFTVDSSKPVTVVTQFLTEDGTDGGDLSEIRRFYVQGGEAIPNSKVSDLGDEFKGNSITDEYCDAQKKEFGDRPDFQEKGHMKIMGEAMERGMVLVMSLWDDVLAHMLWLDSAQGRGGAKKPGVLRGPCSTDTGVPAEVRQKYASATVSYTNVKYGEINSTFAPAGGSAPEQKYSSVGGGSGSELAEGGAAAGGGRALRRGEALATVAASAVLLAVAGVAWRGTRSRAGHSDSGESTRLLRQSSHERLSPTAQRREGSGEA